MSGVLLGFLLSLACFVGIGAYSSVASTGTSDDYLLAGRSVPPWLAALSSVATNNSGFMFVGMIGFTFREGFSAVWMAVAWVLGDAVAWGWVHPRVRALSGRTQARSVPAMLTDRADRSVVVAASVLTVLFLGGYAAAQLQAGSTALEQLFGWPSWVGAVIGAGIVVVYCTSGGLRASIWTDAAQSMVMFVAMAVLLGVAVVQVGGPAGLHAGLAAQDPALVDWFPHDLSAGLPLYVLGFLLGGFGAIGQPHILIRTMSVGSVAAVRQARRTYFAWFVPFYVMGVLVALYARVLMPELAVPPPGTSGAEAAGVVTAATERALPALSLLLLPDLAVGLVLAGLFAATMSTADSQILSCSAAITEDLVPAWREVSIAPKLATLGVTALALVVALTAGGGVFALVLSAWGALGATLGPIVLLRVLGRDPGPRLGLAMMAVGLAVLFGWRAVPGGADVYSLLPAFVAALLTYGVGAGVAGAGPAVEAVDPIS